LPTTLPTFDELIGLDGITPDNVDAALLARTSMLRGGHVFTLHAELEGMKLLPALTRLLRGWQQQGYRLCSLKAQFAALDITALPRCAVARGSVPGRSGLLALQAGGASA
jgi:hypothetical protein